MDRNDETTRSSNRLGRGFRRLALVLFAVLFVLSFQFAVGQAWSNRLDDYRTLGLQRQPA